MFKVHSGLNRKCHYETHRCVRWTYANNTIGETEALRWHPKCKQGQLPWRSLTRRGLLELCKVPEDIRTLRQKGILGQDGVKCYNVGLHDLPTSTDYVAMKASTRLAEGESKPFLSLLLFFLLASPFPSPRMSAGGKGMQPVSKWFLHTMKHKGIAESLVGLFRSKRPAIFLDSDRVSNLT